jgi:hypothetical protein
MISLRHVGHLVMCASQAVLSAVCGSRRTTELHANRYQTWPIDQIVRDHGSHVIPPPHGLMAGDRDALLFSVAISLKRIADSLEALSTVIAMK